MKTEKIFQTSILGVLFLSLLTFGSCKKEIVEPVIETPTIETPTIETPLVALTDEEIEDLRFLREEEKLAHDVYLYAYEKHNIMIFQNISNSEQTHMTCMIN